MTFQEYKVKLQISDAGQTRKLNNELINMKIKGHDLGVGT